ncbi:MAG: hypothetical protein ACREMY_11430, partial [bacterium]
MEDLHKWLTALAALSLTLLSFAAQADLPRTIVSDDRGIAGLVKSGKITQYPDGSAVPGIASGCPVGYLQSGTSQFLGQASMPGCLGGPASVWWKNDFHVLEAAQDSSGAWKLVDTGRCSGLVHLWHVSCQSNGSEMISAFRAGLGTFTKKSPPVTDGSSSSTAATGSSSACMMPGRRGPVPCPVMIPIKDHY